MALFAFSSLLSIGLAALAVDPIPEDINQHIQEFRKEKYAVVFDGGSTGSRVHVFKFQRDLNGNDSGFHFDEEYFAEVKPGLSAYSSNPKKAAKSLLPLLQFAEKHVPDDMIEHTSLQVMATAGLRLLPGDKADRIVNAVDKLMRAHHPSFKIDDDAVSIIDGTSEGIFGWFTMNYLLNLVRTPQKTVAVLDLGGGSTQITFVPRKENTISESKGNIIPTQVVGNKIELYTRSYLGYGLRSARKAILLSNFKENTESLSSGSIIKVQSPCLRPSTSANWTFEGMTYIVSGVAGNCNALVKAFVTNGSSIQRLTELNDMGVYAISFYFDRAAQVGIIEETAKSGLLKVSDYLQAAQIICNSGVHENTCTKSDVSCVADSVKAKAKHSYEFNPFVCIDLTFIGTLLSDGYGLKLDKEIAVAKKLHGVEASWALGAVLKYLDS